ncbi:hypothetical protein KAR91_44825, partial [Candidatus Pacearchaeota archaeon]|nr:hypothetical protein [Candidatus Pacearchaeota archaeon]
MAQTLPKENKIPKEEDLDQPAVDPALSRDVTEPTPEFVSEPAPEVRPYDFISEGDFSNQFEERKIKMREDIDTELLKPPELEGDDPAGPPPPDGVEPKRNVSVDEFNPEGNGYDYKSAKIAGLTADQTGHMPSRDPNTGLILKGMSHPTIDQTLIGEQDAGMQIYKAADGRYYSRPTPPEGAEEVPEEAPDEAPTVSKELPIGKRVDEEGNLFVEIPKQILGGARDAFVEGVQALESVGDWMREKAGSDLGGKITFEIPEVEEGGGTAGSLTRGLSQFLTGFLPILKGVKIVSGGKAAAKGAEFARGAAAGAITDATVFDPDDPNISNLINDLDEDLRNPLTEFLATDPNDAEAFKRFQKATEGLLIGDALVGFYRVTKAMKASMTAKASKVKAKKIKPVDELSDDEFFAATEISGATRKFMGKIKPEVVEGINFRRINADTDIKTIIAQRADKHRAERAAIREPISREQTIKDAKALGLTPAELLRMEPQRMNTPEAFAMRDLRVASAIRIKRLAEVAHPGSKAEAELIKQTFLHMKIELQVTKATKEAGLKLGMFAEPVGGSFFGEVEFAEIVGKTIDDLPEGVNPQQMRRMFLSLETPEQLAEAGRRAAKPGRDDALLEVWINSLLSGPQTHAV